MCYFYGFTVGKKFPAVNPHDLIERDIRMKGFWGPAWFKKLSYLAKTRTLFRIKKLMREIFVREITKVYALDEIDEAINACNGDETVEYVSIKPNLLKGNMDGIGTRKFNLLENLIEKKKMTVKTGDEESEGLSDWREGEHFLSSPEGEEAQHSGDDRLEKHEECDEAHHDHDNDHATNDDLSGDRKLHNHGEEEEGDQNETQGEGKRDVGKDNNILEEERELPVE
jgi:hypothetical protein